MLKVKKTNENYISRDSRNKFIAKFFSKYLESSVINIGGGGEKQLLKYIQPNQYLELDIVGEPDIKLNLDQDCPLPLANGSAETIVCTDVLEHLNELHYVFEELIRISNRYVIISVPNAFIEIRPYLKRKKYDGDAGAPGEKVGLFSKFYGLPLHKPDDRHRWFFSYTEAEHFFHGLADKLKYEVIEEVPIGASSNSLLGKLARLFVRYSLGESFLKDYFYSTYWCVLEKKSV